MSKRRLSFDSKVYDLVEHFLNDPDIRLDEYEDDIKEQFAMHLQQEIEDWITFDLPAFKKGPPHA